MTLATVAPIDADVAIVGSGFAGSLAALALLKRGRRVVLVERGRHPRFAIGESSTPLANLLLEELSDRYDLPKLRVFSKWGTWQRQRPDVACGLKRGFTFFFHRPGEVFQDDAERRRQLLVAASPHDEIADTHWYRPEFDQALAQEAQAEGAVYLDMTRLDRLRHDADGTILEGERDGRPVRITARFVIDASGPRGFMQRALGLAEAPLRWLPPTQGIFTHFEGVERWDRLRASPDAPPYPIDDAALHHVFSGGWIWMLRFNNGLTSAGAALTDPAATAIGAADGAAAWGRLLATLPAVADQFRSARAVLPFIHAPRVAFRSARVAGHGWALLPSAAGVIDPLLSTGFPLTLLGILRLVDSRYLSEAEYCLAQARAQPVYVHSAGPLGRTSGPGLPGLCFGLAASAGGRFSWSVFSVAGELRAHALRLCDRDAGWTLDASERILRNLTHMVDHRSGDPVLASHRTCSSAMAGLNT
jgi:FADH2 O2-dependent halogenase